MNTRKTGIVSLDLHNASSDRTDSDASSPKRPSRPSKHKSGPVAPKRRTIKYKLDKTALLSELNTLSILVNRSTNVETSYYEMMFGVLHNLISKHVTVNISGSVDSEKAEALRTISLRVLEKIIKGRYINKNSLIYRKGKYTVTTVKMLFEVLERSVTEVINSNLLAQAEKRVNDWYDQMLEYNIQDFAGYLNYASRLLNEIMILEDINEYTIYNDLRCFSSEAKKNLSINDLPSFAPQTSSHNSPPVFSMHNLDKAIQIIMQNRHILRTYFSTKESERSNVLSKKDIVLVVSFLRQHLLALKSIMNAHNLIDKDMKYVDIKRLTDSEERNENAVVYNNPATVRYSDCVNTANINYYINNKYLSPDIIKYLEGRLFEFKQMVINNAEHAGEFTSSPAHPRPSFSIEMASSSSSSASSSKSASPEPKASAEGEDKSIPLNFSTEKAVKKKSIIRRVGDSKGMSLFKACIGLTIVSLGYVRLFGSDSSYQNN
ncbi:hypothetical protein NEAUS05_1024 [Nematocida ausubeli]|nr:hypothetical protein NEAUS05_1024 [Nematocida ausubeli]